MAWISRRELARILKETEYWRSRCAALENSLDEQRERRFTDLKEEHERNRQREERLVDRIATSKGSYPVSERKKVEASSPEPQLTAVEEAELDMFRQSAIENGYSPEIGRRMWEAKRAGRPFTPPAKPAAEQQVAGWEEFGEMEEIQN